MSQFIRIETTILPGRRIEITSPHLPDSGPVEVLVVVPGSSSDVPAAAEPETSPGSIVEFLDSLPVGPRSAASWQELDTAFDEERRAWDR